LNLLELVAWIIAAIAFGGIAVFFWRHTLTMAFRESRLQGRLCIFPLYAIYYGIRRGWLDVNSVIRKFMKAGAVRDVKAAYACWSPQFATEEEITDFIRGRYDLFAGYDRVRINHSEATIDSSYVSGDVTYTGNQSSSLEASVVKENKVWKISGIRIGSTEKGTVTSVSRPIDTGPVDTGS
jgi:hypothetical protein